ncbi:hypothetical protein Tco_1245000 [Tanacetum coccineum]
MAVLDSCPKHNMVAYLEKTEGNEEFHEIIDFLKRSSIHHALTIGCTSSKEPSEAQQKKNRTPSPFSPLSEVPYDHRLNSSPAHTMSTIEHQPDPSQDLTHDTIPFSDHQEIQDLKAQITKLKKQAKPVIKHHQAYLKNVSLKQRFSRKSFSKKHRVHKESVSK